MGKFDSVSPLKMARLEELVVFSGRKKKISDDDWTRHHPLGTSEVRSRNLRKPCEGVESLDVIGK